MGDVRKVSTLDELNKIMSENDRIVLDMGAPSWCVPCQRLSPHFAKAAEKSDATFVEVDIENADKDILEKYPTMSVPTVLYLQNGQEAVTISARTSIAILREIGE